jgi:hypothetical protein
VFVSDVRILSVGYTHKGVRISSELVQQVSAFTVLSCVRRCSLSCGILFECVVIEHCSSLRVEVIIISGPSVESGSK